MAVPFVVAPQAGHSVAAWQAFAEAALAAAGSMAGWPEVDVWAAVIVAPMASARAGVELHASVKLDLAAAGLGESVARMGQAAGDEEAAGLKSVEGVAAEGLAAEDRTAVGAAAVQGPVDAEGDAPAAVAGAADGRAVAVGLAVVLEFAAGAAAVQGSADMEIDAPVADGQVAAVGVAVEQRSAEGVAVVRMAAAGTAAEHLPAAGEAVE